MTCNNSTLTQKRLKEALHYNPETGVFTWAVSVSNVKKGNVLGGSLLHGYRGGRLDNKFYLAHRLAFLYMEGKFPPDQVDHINRITSDNRWCNLRHSTQFENHRNRKNNCSFIGVGRARGGWQARADRNKEGQKYLGYFKTHLAACYCKWAWEQK